MAKPGLLTVVFFLVLSLDSSFAAPRDATFLGNNIPDAAALLNQIMKPNSETANNSETQLLHDMMNSSNLSDEIKEMLLDPQMPAKLSNIVASLKSEENYPKLSAAATKIAQQIKTTDVNVLIQKVSQAVNDDLSIDAQQLISIMTEVGSAGAVKVTVGSTPVHLAEKSCVSSPSKSITVVCSSDNKQVTVTPFSDLKCANPGAAAKVYNTPASLTELGESLSVDCDSGVLASSQSETVQMSVFSHVSCAQPSLKLSMEVRADGQCRSALKLQCDNKKFVLSRYDTSACVGDSVTSTVPHDMCFEMSKQGVKFSCLETAAKGLSVPLPGGGSFVISGSTPLVSTGVQSTEEEGGLGASAITGIVLGVVGFLGIVGIAVYMIRKKKKEKEAKEKKEKEEKEEKERLEKEKNAGTDGTQTVVVVPQGQPTGDQPVRRNLEENPKVKHHKLHSRKEH